MRLIDSPYDSRKKQFEIDMLQGNISRVCVSDDLQDILVNLGFAVNHLCMLACSRVLELELEKLESAESNVESAESDVETL